MDKGHRGKLYIGWGQADITPDEPVLVSGQFYARISEGIMDPVTATALVMESRENGFSDYAVMISCDLAIIPGWLGKTARDKIKKLVPGIEHDRVIINATHTHTAPECRTLMDGSMVRGANTSACGVDLPVMNPADYVDFAAARIAEAVKQAWEKREPGSVGFGVGHAVVGRNRRISYRDGTSRMYGETDDENFSHVEGYEDHSVNLLGTWNSRGDLTGLVVNVACPSQVSEHSYLISGDYWHDTRQELRRRFGKDLFVLSQCSAAGDQSPRILAGKKAEERMWRLSGITERQDIAIRISDAVEKILPLAKMELDAEPVFGYLHKEVKLTRNILSEEALQNGLKEAEKFYAEYDKLKKELEANPDKKKEPRWYRDITRNYRLYRWHEELKERFESQKDNSGIPVDIHLLRLGDVVFAANPFEYYLDFGMRIKARSKAVQTFIVQLAGSGTYVPAERSLKGGGYGSIPTSNPVGDEGGRQLVEVILEGINQLWK